MAEIFYTVKWLISVESNVFKKTIVNIISIAINIFNQNIGLKSCSVLTVFLTICYLSVYNYYVLIILCTS